MRGASALAWMCVVLALALAPRVGASPPTAAAAVSTGSPAALSRGSGAPFAIADFDGDQHPDLARVQIGESSSYQTQYWIQLQLTHEGRQLIGVVAPIGGLQLAASDVNGDHAIDLVLSTVWLNRPVAILLNDGHGQFTAEKPSAFPDAFRRAVGDGISQTRRSHGAASATPTRLGIYAQIGRVRPAAASRGCRHRSLEIVVSAFWLPHRGRAPPYRI